MTTEQKQSDAAHKEAFDYWGYLIKHDKSGTETFDRLLKGIATFIVCPSALPYLSLSLQRMLMKLRLL